MDLLAQGLKYSAVIVGSLYMTTGSFKVLPIGPIGDIMIKSFAEFSRVFPNWAYRPGPIMLRTVVGGVEVLCGALMVFGPPAVKKAGAGVIFGIMAFFLWMMACRMSLSYKLFLLPVAATVGIVHVLLTDQDKLKYL